MHGVGPGTILGGRYVVQRRLSHRKDLERWSAHDNTLERDVAITAFWTDQPVSDAALDAARRAAGVEDSRLVRILDVGAHEGLSYIVEESLAGSQSLATLLTKGSLPAEEARRMAGEVAGGLETARQRGLHHLRLTPHAVYRTSDGSIKVGGTAIAAAVDGAEEPDSAAASRTDTLAVVAIAYAALTSRWPLPERVEGVDPAPRVVGGVAAPSEIAAGVPGDLDALCRMTLNEGSGPRTPGEFAAQIAPWSREAVHRDNQTEPTIALTLPVPHSGGSTRPAGPGAAAASGTGGIGVSAASVSGKVGSFARAAAEKAAAARLARADPPEEHLSLPDVLSLPEEPVEPPLPMLPASTAEDPSRDQSKIAVSIVVCFVLVALLAAYCGVRNLGAGNGAKDTAGATPGQTVTVSAPTVTVAPTQTPPSQVGPSVPAGTPIAVISARGFDPAGDNAERNADAAKVYDGKTSTQWTSEGYVSAQFGGLKDGVGVLLDLRQPTKVAKAVLTLGAGPTDVTVYAANAARLEGAVALGAKAGASGTVDIVAPAAAPSTQFVIIWFTSAAPMEGRFRAVLKEVALS